MNFRALLNTSSSTCRTLPIVILYVTEGCNLRCITCSYRVPLENELTLPEIEELALGLKKFGLRHIVYSGGEPLMRRDLPEIGKIFQNLGVRQTLLTNGLLLEKRLEEINGFLSEIIVSIDGPTAAIHDTIRGAESFERIVRGVRASRTLRGGLVRSIRTVLQRRNFRSVMEMVPFARSLGVHRISFLAADVLSDAFGRKHSGGPASSEEDIRLDGPETAAFRVLVERMILEYADEFRSAFIADPPRHLLHIVEYFEALAGKGPFPRNLCNAPMVSAVITSTGDLLPCYFLPSYANVRSGEFRTLINSSNIRSTRDSVRDYSLERCKTCVCTLHVGARAALLDHF
jgi:MoaA/NifB/PqqE/SkfB family radical SAM enzyme